MQHTPGQGFFLESNFSFTDEVLEMVAEYLPEAEVYNCYLPCSSGENPAGVARSSVRVEVSGNGAMWSAETIAFLEGEETRIQSCRMTRLG